MSYKMAAMRNMVAIFFVFAFLGFAPTAYAASQAEAKEVARINNCLPKKIDVYQQSLGPDGQTIYRVDCAMPKTQDSSGPTADALLIGCDQNLCNLVRSLSSDKK